MTGYFVRAQRGGRWQAVEIDSMTDAELDEFLKQSVTTVERGHMWIKALAGYLRDYCVGFTEASGPAGEPPQEASRS